MRKMQIVFTKIAAKCLRVKNEFSIFILVIDGLLIGQVRILYVL